MTRSKSPGKKAPMAIKRCPISETVEAAKSVEKYSEMLQQKEQDINVLGETQEALRSSEEGYRNLTDNLMEGISQTTLDGKFLMANMAFARILGYDSPASLMANITDVNSQLQVDPLRQEQLIAQIKQGPVTNFESQIYRRDGSKIWVSVNSRPSYDENGDFHHIEGVMMDITDRKKAEETLRKSALDAQTATLEKEVIAEIGRIVGSSLDIESVYRRFAEEANKLLEFETITISLVDHETDSFTVAFTTAFGNSALRLELGRTYPLQGSCTEASIRDRATTILRIDELSTYDPKTECGDYSFLSAPLIFQDKAIGALVLRSLSGIGYQARDIQLAEEIANQIAGAIGISQIYGDLQKAEASQRESQARYRNLVDNLIEGVFQSSPDGAILMSNIAMARMLGYGSEAELVATVTDVGKQLHVNPVRREELKSELMEGPVTNFEAQLYRKDGEIIWVTMSARAVYDDEQRLSHFEGTFSDITDRKTAEEALQKSVLDAQRTATEKEAIAEIGRIVGSSLDIESVYRRFADEAHKLIAFQRITITLVDYDTDSALIAFTSAFAGNQMCATSGDEFPKKLGHRYPLKESVTAETIRKQTTIIFQRDESSKSFLSNPKNESGTETFLSTPLIFQDRMIGALVFRSVNGGTYDERDIQMAEGIGNQIAGAIGISEMYGNLLKAEAAQGESQDDAQRTAIEQAAIAEIGRTIGSSLEIASVYERFAEEAHRLIAFDQINVCLANPGGETTKVAFTKSYGAVPLGKEQGDSFPLAGTITEATMQKRRCIVLNDEDAARSFTIPSNYAIGLGSALSTALIFQDRSIGALVFLSRETGAYDENDIRLAEGIGDQIAGAIGISQMYGDLQYAQAAQRESEAQYHKLVDNLTEGVFQTTPGGAFLMSNISTARMLGYDSESELMATITDMGKQLYVKPHRWEELKAALMQGTVTGFEAQFYRKDREIIWVSMNARAIYDDQGELSHFEGTFNEITKRKSLEHEVAEYTDRLENANRELQQLDELKDNFLASVSHELRTPLTAIKGSAEILLDGQGVDDRIQGEFLAIINKECDRLTRLIEDLLDLARIESGEESWNEEWNSISEIIGSVTSGLSSLTRQKNIAVTVALDPELPNVRCDKDKISQVLTNLLSNAIKFTPMGGAIQVSGDMTVAVDGEGRHSALEISVSDSGIGMAAEDLEVIFQKFKQVGDTPDDVKRGTGLGLAIGKKIVDHYGGEIWAESEVDKGSVVTFTLPIGRYHEDSDPWVNDDSELVFSSKRDERNSSIAGSRGGGNIHGEWAC